VGGLGFQFADGQEVFQGWIAGVRGGGATVGRKGTGGTVVGENAEAGGRAAFGGLGAGSGFALRRDGTGAGVGISATREDFRLGRHCALTVARAGRVIRAAGCGMAV
jgi:hypothetical protein